MDDTSSRKDLVGVHAPEFPEHLQWLNSAPLTLKQLLDENKVVLLGFWTYSCVNCIRTLPYLKKWWNEYADKGLMIIGIHTPEFAFEKELENVREAVEAEEIEYPVVLDTDKALWDVYANKYWPHKFLIDSSGMIVYDHHGEGEYLETEHAIRKALQKARPGVDLPPITTEEHFHNEGAVCYPPSGELYCGYYRGSIGNFEGFQEDEVHTYADPGDDVYAEDQINLDGDWESSAEFVRHDGTEEGMLGLFYKGTEVNVVAKNIGGEHRKVYLTLDGQPLDPEVAGDDVIVDDDGTSYVNIVQPKMYQIIKDPEYGEHVLQFTTTSPNLHFFAFTFSGCLF